MNRIFNLVSKYSIPSEFVSSELRTLDLNIDISPKISKEVKEKDSKEDNNNESRIIPYPVQELKPYFILMLKPNCDLLLGRFMAEDYTLRLSDAYGMDFSFESSLERLNKGYTVTQFDYGSGVPSKVCIYADGYGIFIQHSNNLAHCFNFEDCRGVLLGPLSSTFQRFFHQRRSLKPLALEETDCFSILAEFQSFDFATHSDTARYDILQVVSFYLSARAKTPYPVLPLKHADVVFYKVKHKIQDMAHRRFMTVKEFLIVRFIQLAITKALIVFEYPTHMLEKVKVLLNKSFSASSKLFRVSIMMKPSGFKSSARFNKKYKDTLRKVILTKRKGNRVFDSIFKVIKTLATEDSKNQGRMPTRVLAMNKKKEEWRKAKNFLKSVQ